MEDVEVKSGSETPLQEEPPRRRPGRPRKALDRPPEPPATPAPAQVLSIGEETLETMWNVIGFASVQLAALAGVAGEDVSQALAWSPEERKIVNPPTKAMLEKYAGRISKWEVEIAFVGAVGTVVGTKVKAIMQLRRGSHLAPVVKMEDRAKSAEAHLD